jgi:HK97 family phage major capsid protein
MLWQWPVFISSSVPSIGASATPVLFGSFKNVVLAYQGLGLTVLYERFADQNLLGYQLYTRTASKLIVPNSIKSLKQAAS